MKLVEIISEKYVNIIGNDADNIDMKKEYLDEVWNMVQTTYAPIGGIKGNGFHSKEDMLNIPFWKIYKKDGIPRAAIFYKDRHGRKSVAKAHDGTKTGMYIVKKWFNEEKDRSYSELSKGALTTALRRIDDPEKWLFDIEKVKKIKPDVVPLKDITFEEYPEDAKVIISKFPYIEEYGYLRNIGGNQTFKVMLGTPFLSIF